MFRWTSHLKVSQGRTFSAVVTVGNKLYSFGGYNENNNDQIHVSIFNTVSLRWMKLPPVASGRGQLTLDVPANRVQHTAVLINHVIYIWGGVVDFDIEHNGDWKTINGKYCNVLYAFNVDNHIWFKPKISGTAPEGRRNHSACVLGEIMYRGEWGKLRRFLYLLPSRQTKRYISKIIDISQ